MAAGPTANGRGRASGQIPGRGEGRVLVLRPGTGAGDGEVRGGLARREAAARRLCPGRQDGSATRNTPASGPEIRAAGRRRDLQTGGRILRLGAGGQHAAAGVDRVAYQRAPGPRAGRGDRH